MNKMQEQVAEFMRKAGQTVREKPKAIDIREWMNREALIKEELRELDRAMWAADIVETSDAIGDLLYVVIGTACTCGINIQPIWDEIHRSNMTKFIDGHMDPQSGKWIKGPSYSPANLKPIIDEQMK